jgi:peptidoglycan/LPS O-acetylase OafA/YrhL
LPWLLALGITVLLAGVLSGIDVFSVLGLALILYTLTMRSDAERSPFFWRARTLRRFGRLSYAFYMSFAVAEFVLVNLYRAAGWTPPSHAFIYAGAMVLITLALSTALHTLIENPCRRAVDRWLDAAAGGG